MEILLPGLCAALILVGMHAYLGIHVLTRGVIFVDLAMAQSAALGTMIGYVFFQHSPEHPISYLFSLGFTLLHAAMFAAGRSRHSRVPEEAIIGLTYAILSALTVLLIDRAPHGAERIRDMLAGQVLWVSWTNVLQTGLLYGTIGLIHFVWRRRFFLVSQDPEEAQKQGLSVPLWDFLFYATFGIVITSSVAIGGVLLVFSLLVAPALMGFLYASTFRGRLLVGYGFGFVVTLGGFAASYKMDLPTGATVVALFGMLLFPLGLWRYIRHTNEGRAVRGAIVAFGFCGIAALSGFAWTTRPPAHLHPPVIHETPHQHNIHTHKPSTESHQKQATPNKQSPTPRPHTKPQARRPTPRKSELQHRSIQLQKLLLQLEGGDDTPLLERQAAFLQLCKLTKGTLPACPFRGDLFQLDGWLKQQAKAARQVLKQRHVPGCCTESHEPGPHPHKTTHQPATTRPAPTTRPTPSLQPHTQPAHQRGHPQENQHGHLHEHK